MSKPKKEANHLPAEYMEQIRTHQHDLYMWEDKVFHGKLLSGFNKSLEHRQKQSTKIKPLGHQWKKQNIKGEEEFSVLKIKCILFETGLKHGSKAL